MRTDPCQPETAVRTCSSIAASRSLTSSAPNPMKPPSLAASAAACAVVTSHRPKAPPPRARPWRQPSPALHAAPRAPASPGRAGRRGLVPLQRVVLLLRHRLDLQCHLGQELLAARWIRGALERRHGLLGGLDGPSGVGERDGHPGHERCPYDPGPLVLGEITLRRHGAGFPPLGLAAQSLRSLRPRRRHWSNLVSVERIGASSRKGEADHGSRKAARSCKRG